MEIAVVCIFILGYLAITLEHQLKIDKLIPALLMMVLTWTIVSIGMSEFTLWFNPEHGKLMSLSGVNSEARSSLLESSLLHHFGKTAEILIFLMGAMTIVEMMDHFDGFEPIKRLIATKSKKRLLLVISIVGFLLSAVIDNLTATIVLITILRKLVSDPKLRLWYAAFIVLAANAGGAWSPIGDVTTTMLWIAGKVSSLKLISLVAIPSIISITIPLLIANFLPVFRGHLEESSKNEEQQKYSSLILISGLVLIIAVPFYKVTTHLPPYMGMLLSLSLFALLAEWVSKRHFALTNISDTEHGFAKSPTLKALSKIEMPSILFFLGILMTISAMESLGLIYNFGQMVSQTVPKNVFVTLLGVSSAVIDNVPLVAATTGMFREAPDASLWHFIAYAAGTGGSILIIGSAAGVVAMGMEKISFNWYLKNISLLAAAGYLAGALSFILLTSI